MSTLRNPIGPKSKGVYVRRRLFVLVGLLAVVAFVVLVIVRPGTDGGAAKAPEVKMPEELVAAEQAETGKPGELPNCGTGELAVTPLTDGNSYAAGQSPLLALRIESRAEAACQADLGTAGMSFVITSGSDQIWRSTDCQENPDHRNVILQPGEALETEPFAWDRTRSNPDSCDAERPQVVAGGATYHLHVAIFGVQGSGTASFLLY